MKSVRDAMDIVSAYATLVSVQMWGDEFVTRP